MTPPLPPIEPPLALALATELDPTTHAQLREPEPRRRDESAADLGLAALADVRASFMRPS